MLRKITAAACALAMLAGVSTALPKGMFDLGVSIETDAAEYGDFEYYVLNDETVAITSYNGKAAELEIPDEIDGKKVRVIDAGAFEASSELKSVTVPDSVTSIGPNAFSNCTSLESINIPNGVTVIGSYAFYHCICLKSMTIPNSVSSIGYWAFCECYSLTSITIPNSITEIEEFTFYDCPDLTGITIPDSVKSIDYLAFGYCTSLESINIPRSVTRINSHVFEGCTSLKSINVNKKNKMYSSVSGVLYNKDRTELICCPIEKTEITIPDSVTSIGDSACYRCANLSSIKIPNGVTSIGDSAFCECENIKSVIIPKSVTKIGDNAFGYYYGGSWTMQKLDGFKIYCFENTAGEQYAKDNGIEYVLIKPGDVNGDGDVNMLDLTALQRRINGWNNEVVEAALDVNGDGDVNMLDLTALQRKINGWKD